MITTRNPPDSAELSLADASTRWLTDDKGLVGDQPCLLIVMVFERRVDVGLGIEWLLTPKVDCTGLLREMGINLVAC